MWRMSIQQQYCQSPLSRRNQRLDRGQWFSYWPMMLTGLVLGLVIISSLWVWEQVRDPKTLPFREVRVQGQFQRLDAAKLQHIAEQSINGGFFALNMNAVQKNVMATPWVEEVTVRRIPGVLIVGVREHLPIARWNDQFLLNSHQDLFLAPQDAPSNLPKLAGPEGLKDEVFTQYQKISNIFKPLNLSVNQLQLSERGSWDMVLDNGIQVTIGRDDVLPRVQRLAHWYTKLVGDKAAAINSIDLRYQNSIAISWKSENH